MIRLDHKANWKHFIDPVFGGDWYRWGEVLCHVTKEEGYWHISLSHPWRDPTWNEIYTAWYDLVPNAENISGAIILPPKAEYVNLHPNCFHVHQLKDTEITR